MAGNRQTSDPGGAASRPPPVPRNAATVLIVRQGARDVELFMVQRPARGDFPDLHVFPGGKVDGHDGELEHACQGLDDAEASRRLALREGGLRYWVTAIRECFEESGVLLAYRDGALFEPRGDGEEARFEGYRNALAAGGTSLGEVVAAEGLTLATDRVAYFSHWITPEMAPARFDTRFFVAVMPPNQSARGHLRETVGGDWISPTAALERFDANEWLMIFPTLTTLGMVKSYRTVDALFEAVSSGCHAIEVTPELHVQGMQDH